jgi:hypothetical protein
MRQEDIFNYCLQNFEGTVLNTNWGEQAIFYNPNNTLKKGVYVVTIKEKDGANDYASKVNRDGVFRINISIRKDTFQTIFGTIPKRPTAGNIVDMNYDFTQLNTIMPHPIYAWMGWICILNPTSETFETLKPLLQEAYDFAKEKFNKRK